MCSTHVLRSEGIYVNMILVATTCKPLHPTTHLYMAPGGLQPVGAACDGVWLALSHHLLRCLVELLESIKVQVAGYTLVRVCVLGSPLLHLQPHP